MQLKRNLIWMKTTKYNILYVDDEEANLRVFKNAFFRYFNILVASSAEKGLEIIKNNEIHLIVTDQRMPETTGVEFINKANFFFKGKVLPKFILLTAYSDLSSIMEAVNSGGVWRYLTKPWDQNELKLVLDNALSVYQIEVDKFLTETELKESKERLQLAINSSGMGLWDWSVKENQFFLNTGYADLLSYSSEEQVVSKTQWLNTIHPDDKKVVTTILEDIVQDKEGVIKSEFRLKKSDESFVWVLFEGKVVARSNNLATRVVGVVRDITREKFEGERLIATILETEDKERKRLAKEIHDSLGQNLTAAFMHFEVVRLDLKNVGEKVVKNFNRGFEFLNTCINESRDIAYNLMPKAISDYGYISSVTNLLQNLKGASLIEFDFFTNMNELRLKENVELGLYRITQEAINNILKYSEAAKASIQLIEHEDLVQLSIEDNGLGFDCMNLVNNTMGLRSMENRVKALSGTFIIESAPGKGTYINIEVPKELSTIHQD